MWGVELFISTLAQPEELGVDQSNLPTIIAGAIKKDKQEMAYLKCVMVATANNWAGLVNARHKVRMLVGVDRRAFLLTPMRQ